MADKRVAYIYSPELIAASDSVFKLPGRANIVHSLIKSYQLTNCVDVIPPVKATDTDLRTFHTQDYVDTLRLTDDCDDFETLENANEYGFGYDCPLVPKLYTKVSLITGGTLTAARALKTHDSAIHWCGGWHHAKTDEASGFCYVNDIVVAILDLLKDYDRVLYVDFDLHHGDGVEQAFVFSQRVFCLSLHKYEPGFYPGTGDIDEIGLGKGRYYTANVPLKDGITDGEYAYVFTSVLSSIVETFRPTCVVCQCGADTLNEDPLGAFNLTLEGTGQCVKQIKDLGLPTLYLGGGGYNVANVARCWAHLTSLIVGVEIDAEIPDHAFYLLYSPEFELSIRKGNRLSQNKREELEEIVRKIRDNLKDVK